MKQVGEDQGLPLLLLMVRQKILVGLAEGWLAVQPVALPGWLAGEPEKGWINSASGAPTEKTRAIYRQEEVVIKIIKAGEISGFLIKKLVIHHFFQYRENN